MKEEGGILVAAVVVERELHKNILDSFINCLKHVLLLSSYIRSKF